MYKLTNNPLAIKRIADGALIPVSEDNSDYRDYLTWLKKKGNVPAPAVSEEELHQLAVTAMREWRDNELSRADVQLMKVQDGMTGLGTQKAWREYRIALREWPSCKDFPSDKSRPVAPDSN